MSLRPLAVAAAVALAAPCGPAAREPALVCTLRATSTRVPALHGRARVVMTVRDGASLPVSGISSRLRVASGHGLLSQDGEVTGADGTATAEVASDREGAVIVSASFEGEEGPISCGQLAVSFTEPAFPLVVPDLGRWMR